MARLHAHPLPPRRIPTTWRRSRPLFGFYDEAARRRRRIGRHPSSLAYTLGRGLFASVVPYPGWASIVFVDMDAGHALTTRWSPEKGFDMGPASWLDPRRGRLSSASPGHAVLDLADELSGLVREAIETVQAEAEARWYPPPTEAEIREDQGEWGPA